MSVSNFDCREAKELYFSIYCLITGPNSTIPDPGPLPPRPEPPIPPEPTIPPVTPITTPGGDTSAKPPTTEDPNNGGGHTNHDVDKMLRSIWYSMVNTNIVSVVIIFLLCLVVILVIKVDFQFIGQFK